MVMASAGVNMPGGDGNPSAAASSSTPECRLRRRRRLAPPRAAAAGGEKRVRPASPSSSSSEDDSVEGEEGEADAAVEGDEEGGTTVSAAGGPQPPPPPGPAQAWPMAFGWLSVAGRSREMEDAVSLRPGFCTWVDGSPMHFFGVFDGHGGSHVSTLCRDRMHEFLAEELAAEGAAFQIQQPAAAAAGEEAAAAASGTTSSAAVEQEEEEERAWRAALARTFRRVDALASLACACGRIVSPPCRCTLSGNSGIVGSTAVVAVLVRGRLVVANCGDSRAVLCRGPAGAPPVPLSVDHKPDRPDELARIEAAGGRVVYINGHRVRGILAMSRALAVGAGDRMLRPEVIAEPEITITDRTPEDQCLILASDGMWDVIPNEIACSVARQCLEDGNPAPVDDVPPTAGGEGAAAAAVAESSEPEARCSRAASLLVRLALGRTTWDNVSVVVIDLKQRE
ncbi:probable protein phosphatase 2C 37 isoform X2 [Panicum hallii]|uniref:probable protein phosphatase 2C 37 isoform X2 n=1 Tax=Panicum hallii TaxID=206008 RepID=UPI000DF4DF29|nr:probable protein phosphatase 2C 37 isoform X2 [Panicum hallii]